MILFLMKTLLIKTKNFFFKDEVPKHDLQPVPSDDYIIFIVK